MSKFFTELFEHLKNHAKLHHLVVILAFLCLLGEEVFLSILMFCIAIYDLLLIIDKKLKDKEENEKNE